MVSFDFIEQMALEAQEALIEIYGHIAMTVELMSETLRHVEGIPGDALRMTCERTGRVVLLSRLDAVPERLDIIVTHPEKDAVELEASIGMETVNLPLILKLMDNQL